MEHDRRRSHGNATRSMSMEAQLHETRGALRDEKKYAEQLAARMSTALQKAADTKEKLDAAKKENERLKAQVEHAEKLAQDAAAAEKNMRATLDLHMTISEAGLSSPIFKYYAFTVACRHSFPARLKVGHEERNSAGQTNKVVMMSNSTCIRKQNASP